MRSPAASGPAVPATAGIGRHRLGLPRRLPLTTRTGRRCPSRLTTGLPRVRLTGTRLTGLTGVRRNGTRWVRLTGLSRVRRRDGSWPARLAHVRLSSSWLARLTTAGRDRSRLTRVRRHRTRVSGLLRCAGGGR
ncbi:hypothetical protein GCM10022222_26010 [Amycolatopsis ultiminotia]|uniref:Uncharacterized protein n=1 Tax=Amycolatopsis ultiminotia TaxID=543629 RepID=A0ABP6VTG6_9PSEU